MPFIAIAIRNSNLYSQLVKEAQTNKVLLELATIVFDESSSTVDNLVSRIDETKYYRKNIGRLGGEHYVGWIVQKYFTNIIYSDVNFFIKR